MEKAIELAFAKDDAEDENRIYIREGVYRIKNTIMLDSYDRETPLRISAYRNEKVTLNAGIDIPLSSMEPANKEFTDAVIDKPENGKILQYSLKDLGIDNYGEFSVRGHLISDGKEAQAELSLNGEVQKLAGWPNDGYTGLIKPTNPDEYGKRTKSGIANGCSFAVEYDRPSQWSKVNEVWLAGTLGPNYEFDYYPVESFDADAKRVYLERGAIEQYYTSPYYRFENIPEELDKAGEYYIDTVNEMLYYYPPENAAEDSILTITMSTPTLNYPSTKPNSMFRIENCQNISFEKCRKFW